MLIVKNVRWNFPEPSVMPSNALLLLVFQTYSIYAHLKCIEWS